MSMTNRNLERLPLWAQRHISTLEADVAHYKAMAYEATGDGVSDTQVNPHGGDEIFLPNNERVRFHAKFGYLDVNTIGDDTGITVQSDDRIKIKPISSNLVYIETDRT